MKRKTLAVVLALMLVPFVGSALAPADDGNTHDRTPYTCDSHTARWHYKAATDTIDAGWRVRNWEKGPKRAQRRDVQAHIACLERKKDRRKIQSYRSDAAKRLAGYREYRSLTPFRCQSGAYGYWAIPCSIIECESHFSWSAYNPSGASGPYQLLGWGAPMPANTWARKLAHHRIAAGLWSGGAGRSHWVC